MTSETRLREYVENDEIYQNFINGILKANDMSDFDKFCVQHCLDIQEVLEENKILDDKIGYYIDQRNEWVELLGKFKNQQKEFIKYLEDEIKKLKERDIYQPLQRIALATLEHNLQKYKEIIGVSDENKTTI